MKITLYSFVFLNALNETVKQSEDWKENLLSIDLLLFI